VAEIEVAREADGTAVVTLNRPGKRNALSLAMWREIARLFGELGENADVRSIVLTGAGGQFSVGADISEFDDLRGDSASSNDYERAVDAASDAIAAVPKPAIAAVQGYCLGGGCHLAMACDFRFAAPDAQFGIPAARLSIVYGVRSTQRLLALVGLAKAKQILYGAGRFGAEDALRDGFVDRIADDPVAAARDYAHALAQNAPLSIAGAKHILTGVSMGPGALDPEETRRVIDRASSSEDYAEGRRAFAEKRAPRFKGR